MNAQATAADKALRWHCRRGMRELDSMLSHYLELRYPHAGSEERRAFQELLTQQDDLLWDWLSGRLECRDRRWSAVLRKIRVLHRDS